MNNNGDGLKIELPDNSEANILVVGDDFTIRNNLANERRVKFYLNN